MNGDIAALSLTEAAEAIAQRRFSAVEAVQACLARIERAQPALNCFVAVEAEAALAAAERADAELARGVRRGPLHGVPLAHKDMFYRSGELCACGSKILRDYRPDHTATVLSRLEAAGAIHLGRLNMAEFAMGPTGHNEHFGHCHNPWNPAHITGGSSSGSGAAVAARLVYGALGSDTGGSVRLPAALCGVVGLKPTQTRVSRYGLMPLSLSQDQAGPLVRTVRDCARVLGVIAGADPADPTCAAAPVPDYEGLLERPIHGTRIGVPTNYYYDAASAEVRRAMEESLAVFRRLGAEVVELAMPDHDVIYDLANVVVGSEASTAHRGWVTTRPGDYSAQTLGRLTPGLYLPATRYLEALNLRAPVLARFVDEVFGRVDVVHTPTLGFTAPSLAETDVGAAPGFGKLMFEIARCTRPVNYLGLPALSLPAGFGADGLPVSMQLVGRPFGEARLLALGHAYQRETDWHTRAPSL